MGILENIKVETYEKNRSRQFVKEGGKYPSLSRLATEALRRLNDELEEEAKKK